MKKIFLILFTLFFFNTANAIDSGNSSTSGEGSSNSATNPKDTDNDNCNNNAPGTGNENGATNPDNTVKDNGIKIKAEH